jgi:cysteine desulfurase/selenocysteine lyase
MQTLTTAQIPADEFPIMQHGLYANHAAIAPWPRVTCEAVTAFAQENCELGPEKYARWLLLERRLRERLRDLINAKSADDIALLKNTTEGICTVANGVEWRRGDNLVLPQGEFPSNSLPWLALKSHGVEVREVDIRSSSQPEQALLERMDERTRLLSVSAVQWTDGLRLDLKKLGAACKTNNILFFVDAIQHLGALEMDVQACNIDFLAADGHKWLLAPEGIAVFYSSPSARAQLQLQQRGWHMVDEPYRFERSDWQASETALRFEAGSPNTMGQFALHASLGLLQQFGMGNVEACVAENARDLTTGLNDIAGLEVVREYDPGAFSGIVCFNTPGIALAATHKELKKRQVSCAIRGNAIRLSPHFHQTGKPLQALLNVIEDSI